MERGEEPPRRLKEVAEAIAGHQSGGGRRQGAGPGQRPSSVLHNRHLTSGATLPNYHVAQRVTVDLAKIKTVIN